MDSAEAHANLVKGITAQLVGEGKLIEAGWVGLRAIAIPPDAPQIQLEEMRSAFFAGAQHVFHSIFTILEEGDEATENDTRRLDQIDQELRGFIEDFKRRYGLELP